MKRQRASFCFAMVIACYPLWAVATERGLSVDDSGAPPGAPAPHIAPPGGGNAPRPLVTNRTPVTGVAPLQGGVPQREVQPGEETPQTDDNTQTIGTLRPPRSGLTKDGGHGGSDPGGSGGGGGGGGGSGGGGGNETPDKLPYIPYYPYEKGATGPSSGGASGGDGTQTEDEVYVGRTVRGVDTPLSTGQGLETGPGDPQSGQAAPPGNSLTNQATGSASSTLPTKGSTLPDMPTPGGNSKQSDVNPFPDKKAGGARLDGLSKTPPATAPAAAGQLTRPARDLSAQPAPTPTAKGPGAVVIPRTNCGTHHTGWVDLPGADVNPCPAACERGERISRDERKEGDKTRYYAIYRCNLPERVVNQRPEVARAIEAGGVKGTNCGTFWTGKLEDPDADANPCPANCERGELLDVRRSRSYDGSQTIYERWYRCYQAGTTNIPAARRTAESFRQPELSTREPERRLPPSAEAAGTATAQALNPVAQPRSAAGAVAQSRSDDSGTGPATQEGSTHTVRPVTGAPQGAQIAGTETASASSGIDAAGMKQIQTPAAADRPLSTRNLEGPGTFITAFSDVTATSAKVSWRPAAGANTYELRATAKGLNHSIVQTATGEAGNPFDVVGSLSGLAPGVEHAVSVTVIYPDGRRGVSEPKSLTTAAAENPQGFKATPIGPGAVRLEWQPVSGASEYIVQGDNLPRRQTTDTAVAVSNLSPGDHDWTLIAVYPPGVFNDLNPSRLTANVAADASGRARYRVTVNGFRVDRETADDPLQLDGKGDEVYIGVYMAEYNSRTGQRVRSDVVRTPVFGDKNGFGADRNLAGHAGPTGGLRRSDSYPGTNPAFRTAQPSRVDIPLIVWEGELVAGENHIALIPSIWEWDGDAGGFSVWSNSLRNSAPEARYQLHLALQQAVAEQRSSGWPGAHLNPPSYWGRSDALPPMTGDRLIGLTAPKPGGVNYQYFDRVYALNREFIEAELARTAQASLPPGAISIQFKDEPSVGSLFGGDYTLYLQVERLP